MRNNLIAAVNIGENVGMGTGKSLDQTFPDVSTIINLLLKNSITIAAILLLALLIFGGLKFIMSAGGDDPKKTAAAKALITDAVIGFVIVFAAYFIIQIIQIITGVNILNPIF